MRYRCLASLIPVLVLAGAASAHAQDPRPLPAVAPLRFESWRAASPAPLIHAVPGGRFVVPSRSRERRALLGGAIGAAAGVLACTVVSTLANDSAEGGLSFCPLDSYLLIGGVGVVVGAAIGWVI